MSKDGLWAVVWEKFFHFAFKSHTNSGESIWSENQCSETATSLPPSNYSSTGFMQAFGLLHMLAGMLLLLTWKSQTKQEGRNTGYFTLIPAYVLPWTREQLSFMSLPIFALPAFCEKMFLKTLAACSWLCLSIRKAPLRDKLSTVARIPPVTWFRSHYCSPIHWNKMPGLHTMKQVLVWEIQMTPTVCDSNYFYTLSYSLHSLQVYLVLNFRLKCVSFISY